MTYMGLTLNCGDLERKLGQEPTCPFVVQGENMDEFMANLTKHAKEVHGYTDEQLQDPKTIEAVKAVIKEE